MSSIQCPVIAIANQKGGVGKTTTTVNAAQGVTIRLPQHSRVLGIDFDPQGNFTQASGIRLESIRTSVSDLIRDRSFSEASAIYKGSSFDLIPATPTLAQVEREMVGMTNSELRLAQRIKKLRTIYSVIFIDTPPTLGPLLNSVLNAASSRSEIIPVIWSSFHKATVHTGPTFTVMCELRFFISGANTKNFQFIWNPKR